MSPFTLCLRILHLWHATATLGRFCCGDSGLSSSIVSMDNVINLRWTSSGSASSENVEGMRDVDGLTNCLLIRARKARPNGVRSVSASNGIQLLLCTVSGLAPVDGLSRLCRIIRPVKHSVSCPARLYWVLSACWGSLDLNDRTLDQITLPWPPI